ncbi:uracil-DNA glycosylase [Methyloversatilis thermotolerans]|uniref:uracil-DNA glycosylase n=1 Tax=Methyloversatilis thermotolerans TaxID=1346290 RepID=UPI00035CA8B6|nr:uracil-DNA glycosylase [Methyloversatilis thermotolerans]
MNRRLSILREIGLAPLWRSRQSVPAPAPHVEATSEHAKAPRSAGASAPVGPMTAGNGARRQASTALPARPVAPAVVTAADRPVIDVRNAGWDTLEQAIRSCTACRLHERRTLAVPGVGDRKAEWLFVGEGPGAEEDLRGEPFVGQAGKLLDAMLAALGVARGRGVYIANSVKCRPPGNRTPESDEIACCQPYLERQIELLRPRIIVALGRPAAQSLLGGEIKIAAARGRTFDRQGIPVVVTYHPAYLLRNPSDKAKAWEDLCFARDVLSGA